MPEADQPLGHHPVEWRADGGILQLLHGKVQQGDGGVELGFRLVVVLLGNGVARQQVGRPLAVSLGKVVAGAHFRHGGGLLALVKLDQHLAFPDCLALLEIDGLHARVDLAHQVDRLDRLQRADQEHLFLERAALDRGHHRADRVVTWRAPGRGRLAAAGQDCRAQRAAEEEAHAGRRMGRVWVWAGSHFGMVGESSEGIPPCPPGKHQAEILSRSARKR